MEEKGLQEKNIVCFTPLHVNWSMAWVVNIFMLWI